MLPVIAIVGRPNVGKSTLFNTLTKTRNALVVDLPGTTRDRQYGEGKVGEQPYIIIDTGGVTANDPISQQSWNAVQEADVLLFVVDAQVGVTSEDMDLVRKIRKHAKPVHLIANKIDGVDIATGLAEFFSLGLGNPIPISASTNRGLSQLASTFLEDFVDSCSNNISTADDLEIPALITNDSESLDEIEEDSGDVSDTLDGTIKVAIVGQPNVGKSTLVNRILGEDRVIVSDESGTTRDSIFVPFERDDHSYILIDTAGVRRKGKIKETVEKFSVVKSLQAIDSCNVALFVIDAKKGITDQDLSLLSFVVDAGKALVIAINKWDNQSAEDKEDIRRTLSYKLKFVDFAIIHYISALHGSGVGNLFSSINKAYNSAMKKLSTPQLTEMLERITAAHQLPLINGRRIKLRYAHSGGHNPPRVIIHGNQTDKIPQSYIRYMQKSFIEKLRLVGTPLVLEFITGDNPYAGKRNILTPRQLRKRERLKKFIKKKDGR